MKTTLIILAIILAIVIVFQIYISISTNKSEIQAYEVIRAEEGFEIRYYPSAMLAKISSTSKSYKDLGSSGFGKLAKFIFGGNSENKQIAMTSPVHMEMGDSISTMAFVMPSKFNKDNLPTPNNAEIAIETTEPEYVTAIQFGGFADNKSIESQKALLEKLLIENGIAYYGNFRYLGYNPPYQLFGRRNEVIVAIDGEKYK